MLIARLLLIHKHWQNIHTHSTCGKNSVTSLFENKRDEDVWLKKNQPWLPWCDNAIVWSSNQNKLLDAQKVFPPIWGGKMKKMHDSVFSGDHWVQSPHRHWESFISYLSCCCEFCHHWAMTGRCFPAGSVSSDEGLWEIKTHSNTHKQSVKAQQHVRKHYKVSQNTFWRMWATFQIIEDAHPLFLPFQ